MLFFKQNLALEDNMPGAHRETVFHPYERKHWEALAEDRQVILDFYNFFNGLWLSIGIETGP